MKTNSCKFVATTLGLSFLVAGEALAEDGYGYGYQVAPQAQAQAQVPQQADSNYVVPPAYQGQYYPQETESVVGYHGTSNTSSNTANAAHGEDPYYYYYY